MAAGDLTTLSDVKTFMHISTTAYDTFLTSAITNVTAAVQRECQRTFIASDYLEWQNASPGQSRAQVQNKPIIRINSVRWGYASAIQIQYNGSAISATANISSARMLYLRTIGSGGVTDNTIDLTNASYTLWSQVVAQINTFSGWTAQLFGGIDGPTRWLAQNVNLTCKSAAANYVQAIGWNNIDVFAYLVDTTYNTIGFQPLSSIDWFFNNGAVVPQIGFPGMYQGLLLDYRGGYETIPADLNLLAQQMVADLYNKSNLDMNLSQDKLGDAQVTLIDPMMRSAMYQDALAPYKRIAMSGGMS